ncbi:hypothetical protein [Mangrovihabitans endophyticus]|uniref:Uncharacterized protein n=1 Tax=Mangrovihabitans endophyticus TaxID=1751298 RepID=A0A8J3FT31_9ACTN|nr:hypothetical protein [Mangrovihabitans endophyticus]GGL17892.1 hypothetical protein GCM10012284_60700 [Mangrovihabitans endophyticus]
MTLFDRGPARQPQPWPYDLSREGPSFAVIGLGIVSLFVVISVTIYQGTLYSGAGAHDVGGAAAFAGLLLVALLLMGAASLYRWGFRRRAIAVLAGAAGVLSLAFAVLAAVVGTDGWLACVLSAIVGLLPAIVLAAWATALARYLPMWWSGWGLPEQSGSTGGTD